jgi:hypothetical protein
VGIDDFHGKQDPNFVAPKDFAIPYRRNVAYAEGFWEHFAGYKNGFLFLVEAQTPICMSDGLKKLGLSHRG